VEICTQKESPLRMKLATILIEIWLTWKRQAPGYCNLCDENEVERGQCQNCGAIRK